MGAGERWAAFSWTGAGWLCVIGDGFFFLVFLVFGFFYVFR
jgi:hypothetical protein